MDEENKFKVEIEGLIKDITVQEPVGEDRIRFMELLEQIRKEDNSIAYLKAMDEYIVKYTGLNKDDVEKKMRLVDKDKISQFLFQRMMHFLSVIKLNTQI